jgi:phosphoribosylformylglycinamidine cyclo-ligase
VFREPEYKEPSLSEGVSYLKSGVNVDLADQTKKEMADSLHHTDSRVLNRVGAFASLFEARFDGIREPVLVLKAEEPGSKQLLAFQHDRVEGICYDLINHLINDIAVMGAKPEVVLDIILCGKMDKTVVLRIVRAMAEACNAQGAKLVGGETSEQPGVLPAGSFMLNASVVGVVEKADIIDGSKIEVGDAVVSLASNGIHTNGYSLIRKLAEADPDFLKQSCGTESMLEAVLRPHYCYYPVLKTLFPTKKLRGLAHITGGGIQGNLDRILPAGTAADIDLATLRVPEVFWKIQAAGGVSHGDMLKTFNMGVGLTAVVPQTDVAAVIEHCAAAGLYANEIGRIVPGDQTVRFTGELRRS